MTAVAVVKRALNQQVVEAESRAALGRAHIERQRYLLRMLSRDGLDTDLAAALLESFLDTQTLHEADAERLKAELAVWDQVEG